MYHLLGCFWGWGESGHERERGGRQGRRGRERKGDRGSDKERRRERLGTRVTGKGDRDRREREVGESK